MISSWYKKKANTDKKERLITDEVTANDEYVDLNLNIFLETRKEACKKINEMFPDIKVSVEFNQDIKIGVEKSQSNISKDFLNYFNFPE